MVAITPEQLRSFMAAAVEDPARAERLLRANPDLLRARVLWGETVLHYLAIEGCLDAVRFLARHGADVNLPNRFGETPLLNAVQAGDHAMVDALLELGADANARDEVEESILQCAIRRGDVQAVRSLLRYGADPAFTTGTGDTAFSVMPAEPQARAAITQALDRHGGRRPSTGAPAATADPEPG
jgi:ankyrin repeat protein